MGSGAEPQRGAGQRPAKKILTDLSMKIVLSRIPTNREHVAFLREWCDQSCLDVGPTDACLSAISWSRLLCSCDQRTCKRASSAPTAFSARTTCLQLFRDHSASALRLCVVRRHRACGSTQVSAAERRLMVTPPGTLASRKRSFPLDLELLRSCIDN